MRNRPCSHWLNQLIIAIWVISSLVSSSPAYAQPVVKVEPSARFFIQNTGQFETSARFLLEGSQSRLWLADDGLWLTWFRPTIESQPGQTAGGMLTGVNLHFKFIGANLHPQLHALGSVNTQVNYLSKDESFSPPTWRSVAYTDLYPGIDLIIDSSSMNGSNEFFSWRLEAQSTADLNQVQLQIAGADKVQITQDQLLLDTSLGRVTLPLLETRLGGSFYSPGFVSHVSKAGDGLFDVLFPLRDSPMPRSIVFQASPNDLVYSTYLGGSAWEAAYGIALGQDGSIYVAGRTASQDFPTTPGAFDRSVAQVDAFISKINPAGDRLIYSTILGGTGADNAYGIALAGDQVVVVGDTQSRDFPTTNGAFDSTCGSDGMCNTGDRGPISDAFLTQLSSDGSRLIYSTYLGGRDEDHAYSLAMDSQNVYLTGITYSPDFPASGYKANGDAFVVSFDSSHRLAYGRMLGGSDVDAGFAIAVRGGEAYITGETSSLDFPAQTYQGGRDLFLARLSSSGNIVDASLVGGFGDESGNSLAIDASGNLAIVGGTTSADLPATSGAYNGNSDVMVVLANPDTTVSKLAYIGGTGFDEGLGVAFNATGKLLFTGFTNSSDFPVTRQAFQPGPGGNGDAFITYLDLAASSASQLIYSSYLGGSARDTGLAMIYLPSDQVFLAGYTQSSNFPLTSPNLDSTLNGIQDMFISSLIAAGTPGPIPTLPSPTPTKAVPTQTSVRATATPIGAQAATDTPTSAFETPANVTQSTQPSSTPPPTSGAGNATITPPPSGTSSVAMTVVPPHTSPSQLISTLTTPIVPQTQIVLTHTAMPQGEAGQKANYLWVIALVILVVVGIIAYFVYRLKRS